MVSDSLPPEDHKAHQKRLKRVTFVFDVQGEEVSKKSHKLVDTLASAGPSRVVLLINEAISES